MNKELKRRIAELGRLVAEARDLVDVEAYFHDEVVPCASFMARGTLAVHKPLRDIVANVAKAYGHPLNGCRLHHLREFSLWHGSLGNPLESMAVVVYFDDQHRGMASFMGLPDTLVHRIRFSLPEGARDPDVELGGMELAGFSRRSGPGFA